MLKIRLQRVGRKHETAFRLVLTDSKNSTKSGRFLEILGSYDPRKDKTEKVNLKADRVNYWMKNGAQATDTVHNLLISSKVIEGKKRNVLPRKSPPAKAAEESAADAAPVAEVAAEAAPVEA
jgi:small subunit ribosomal protein S16